LHGGPERCQLRVLGDVRYRGEIEILAAGCRECDFAG
jgi:hypothetical protein